MKCYHYISVPDHVCCKRRQIGALLNRFKMNCPDCQGELEFPTDVSDAVLRCNNDPYCQVIMPVNQAMLVDLVHSVLAGKPIQMIQDRPLN